MEDFRNQLIDGVWTPGQGERFLSLDPYTQQPWAELTAASAQDVDRAVRAARRAFPAWRRTPGVQRGKLLMRLADLMERDIDILARNDTRDNGKIFRENKNQIAHAIRAYRFIAGLADKMAGETKALDKYDVLNFTTREPLGVCALLTAWNSPQPLLSNKLPPALATGNTVVVKPSEIASTSTLYLGRLIEEAGFPPGVVNIVTGAAETGAHLTSHPDINKISFTGGLSGARHIARNAAETIVPATMELGGKSANIIFDDADLDKAIPGAVSGIFAAAGQTCVAGSRLMVQDKVYDAVVKGVVEAAKTVRLGDPMAPETQVGPMAHEAHFHSVKAIIDRAVADGATLLAGGGEPEGMEGTLFIAPTIFENVCNDSHLARTEVFGPVLAIMRFSTEEEAVAMANDSPFGLAAGVWTKDITRGLRVARDIDVGLVWINTYRTLAAQAPSGGTKQSGYGREHGTDVLLDYTATKNTMVNLSDDARDPFLLGT